jgi:hypothetical protein
VKNLAAVVILSSLMIVCAFRIYAADAKIDPSQFPLAVHVSAAEYAPVSSLGYPPFDPEHEIVTATIDGKRYQLEGSTGNGSKCCNGLLNPGDYHARLSKDEHKTSYESLQQFEILFPDGTTRRLAVIAQSE